MTRAMNSLPDPQEHRLTNILNFSLWDPKKKTQAHRPHTSDPHLWANEWVLSYVTTLQCFITQQ